MCASGAQFARASDPKPAPPARIAAANSTPTPKSDRHRRNAQGDVDLWLLVQHAPVKAADGSPGGETVLAVFPLSAPETLEEDVAAAHGLEVAGRSELASSGLRIVRYRVPEGRAVTAIVDRLRADPRVNSAQANVRYRLPEQEAPAIEVSNAIESPGAGSRGGENEPPRASVAAAERELKPPAPKSAERHKRSGVVAQRLAPRIGGVGDVLAGGL